jgi:hypothetical protein
MLEAKLKSGLGEPMVAFGRSPEEDMLYQQGYRDGIKDAKNQFKWITAEYPPEMSMTALVKLDDNTYDLGYYLQPHEMWVNNYGRTFYPNKVIAYFNFPSCDIN